jgi:hypothetical protein
MGYNCLFIDVGVTVFRRSDDSIALKGVLEGQLYLVDFNENTVVGVVLRCAEGLTRRSSFG